MKTVTRLLSISRVSKFTAFRKYSTLLPRGKTSLQDDMSITHGQLLETTSASHLPKTEKFLSNGDSVPCGSHLVYFNHAVAESALGIDGYDNLQAPISKSSQFIRRWVSGSVTFNSSEPSKLGSMAFCHESIKNVEDSSKTKSSEKISVSIEREIRQSHHTNWSIKEIRTSLYLPNTDRMKSGLKRLSSRSSNAEPNGEPLVRHELKLTDVSLFRYSALSFNAHRVHYASEYAKNEEGLPGAIAQGPLMITLMLRWIETGLLPKGFAIYQMAYDVLGSVTANEDIELSVYQSAESKTHFTAQIRRQDGSVVFTGELEISRKPTN